VAASALSGGNQQKVVLARELSDRPAVIVAENPTRGLDIRATAAVHARLRAAAAAGAAVIVYSSDLDEVLALATRVVAVHAGRLLEVPNDREAVGRAMLGLA
jgi:simple sugar transport system ATP-binding protein